MILSMGDQKRFPKFAQYVRTKIPRLAGDKDVVDSMHELVGIDKSKVRLALAFGSPPTVKIVKDNLACVDIADGCFRNAAPNQIEITERVVDRFERGEAARPTNRKQLEKVGVVLLHELVHWADYKVDKKHTEVRRDDPYHDIGSKWEWIVLGEFTDAHLPAD